MSDDKPFARVVALVRSDGALVTDNDSLGDHDDYTSLVISAGQANGVTFDTRFVIYANGTELFDPDSDVSLGNFEIVKGEGKVIHVMPNMSRIKTTRTRRQQRTAFGGRVAKPDNQKFNLVLVPFLGVLIGDAVRPI